MSAKENGSRFKRPVISIRMLPMGKQLQKLPPQVDLQVVSSTKIDDLDFSIHKRRFKFVDFLSPYWQLVRLQSTIGGFLVPNF